MNFQLRLNLSSDPRFLCVVRALLTELGDICGLRSEECLEITLAVDEALANVIRHAYGNRRDGAIEFECVLKHGQLEFTLVDWGEPPDPAKICRPVEDFALSGRGTHLIRAGMDEVLYSRLASGNQLRLIKRLPAPTPGTDARVSETE